MFGKHVEAAEATILFVKYHSSGSIFAKDPRDRSATFEIIVEVRTRDGQPFRTEIQQFFEREPHVGDVVRVHYNPKSKQVKVITKGDARYDVRAFVHATDLAAKAEHDALLAAPAGTPLPQTLAYDAEVARLTLQEHNELRNALQYGSAEGTATVLSIQEMGQAVPPLVGYIVEVDVRPHFGGAPFTVEMDAWLDLSIHSIAPGSTVQVRYDPQNFFRIILL